MRTVPVLEELESMVILSRSQTKSLLRSYANEESSTASTSYVLVTAGEAGVLKFYRLQIQVDSSSSPPLLSFPRLSFPPLGRAQVKAASPFRIDLLMKLALSEYTVRPIASLQYVSRDPVDEEGEEKDELWISCVDHTIYCFHS